MLPHVTLVDAGYKGRIYQTHGAATPDFLRLGGAKVEGTVLAASLMLVLPRCPTVSLRRRVALEYIGAYEKMYGTKPATFGAECLRRRATADACGSGSREARQSLARPSFAPRSATRLESTRELVGTQGVYNMSPADHSGFDERGRVLITVKDGSWRLLRD